MTRADPHRELDTLGHRVLRASVAVQTAYDALDEQRTFVTALKAKVITGPGQKGSVSDPTLLAAQALDVIAYKRKAIDDQIATLGTCIKALESDYAKALGYRVPDELQGERCGYTWVVIDRGLEIQHQCVEYAEYTERADGSIYWRDMCSMHRKKVQRERKREEAA